MLRPFHKFIINEWRPLACWCTEVGACKCVEVIALTAHAPCMPTNCIILFNLAWRHCPLITGQSFLIPYSPLLCADGHVADVAIHVGMWPYCRHFQLHIHFLTFGSGWDFSPLSVVANHEVDTSSSASELRCKSYKRSKVKEARMVFMLLST
jgi:hypothetical protein